jgi:hypothetical protein
VRSLPSVALDKECLCLCRAPGTLQHLAKPLFAECNSLPSATLGKEWLCRMRHSTNFASPVVNILHFANDSPKEKGKKLITT